MSTCPRCGADFLCGMEEEAEDEVCWCMKIPVVPEWRIDPQYRSCLCPACLHRADERPREAARG